MPELPEVETVRRGIAIAAIGQKITDVIVRRRDLREPLPPNLKARLIGRNIAAAKRRAKCLLLEIPPQTMLVRLGMSGALFVSPKPPTAKHAHVAFALNNGEFLVYEDPRRFGSIALTTENPLAHPWLCDLGPEPLRREFSGAALCAAFRGKKTPVKTALMDGRIVAGVGNIYASESLFVARVRPQTPAGKISANRCDRIAAAVKSVLRRAIRAGGSTIRDFVNANGAPGWFQTQWAVYGREGRPCIACETPICRAVLAGRATYHCPRCQR